MSDSIHSDGVTSGSLTILAHPESDCELVASTTSATQAIHHRTFDTVYPFLAAQTEKCCKLHKRVRTRHESPFR
ncbi:hypothetical protein CBOM_05873 [Ceraceosorus bombacis]|uniref:Uncharacterized protein n=1 Tax=Ceraceosorus bombacis TaxID=401625 RepID=A0A0N7LBF1_9BASI|nr:hypothetical protein CBOM_05873 [Ceraceosorus bombacis]